MIYLNESLEREHLEMQAKALAEIRRIWEANEHQNPEAFLRALAPLPEVAEVERAFGKAGFREALEKWYRRQVLELRKAAKEAA